MARFAGKVALITGADSGIGAATARLMAREGARVVVVDLDLAAAQAVAGEIGGDAIRADVSRREEVAAFDAASYMTGAIVVADGGKSAWTGQPDPHRYLPN